MSNEKDAEVISERLQRLPSVPFPRRGNQTTVLFPKRIFIKDTKGRYLAYRPGTAVELNLTFRSGPDARCEFEASRANITQVTLTAENGLQIVRNGSAGYETYAANRAQGNAFFPIVASGNIVYLKDNYIPSLYLSSVLSSFDDTPTARNYLGETEKMEIIQAAVKREILDVVYDINGAQVREADPLIVLSTSVRNDSDGDVNQNLTYSYEKWSVGTWNETAGVEIGAKMSFKAGVPFIASAEWEISVTSSYSHEWGGETGEREIVSSSTTVTVPPKKKARVTVVIRNAEIDVGFTYTDSTVWNNGQSEETKKTGIYYNVDSYFVDVQVDNWEDV